MFFKPFPLFCGRDIWVLIIKSLVISTLLCNTIASYLAFPGTQRVANSS